MVEKDPHRNPQPPREPFLKVTVCQHISTVETAQRIGLTSSLPQPVTFPGWMMHGRAFKSIFSGPITSVFNAMRFDENLSTCQCEKEEKEEKSKKEKKA